MEFEATNDFKENMMMKASGLVAVEENMSNLTSASGEVSASSAASRSVDETATNMFTHHQPPPPKRKRNLPGNPDPNAEVIALSPRALLATNRFICEICNKGFQRDQNLQLHRRGHNLPWKLKQRSSTEVVRKKVYVCPESTCVHHDPSRALGDLTGIKKHFSRKHGEKKWKCEKCSKRYAVQSDWKAHSKICGTKEYRCDCGKVFSRRDSFITHRAFCDVLTEESSRAITTNPLLSNFPAQFHGHGAFQPPLLSSIKIEQQQQQQHQQQHTISSNNMSSLPPWLSCSPSTGAGQPPPLDLSSALFSTNPNPNPNTTSPSLSSSFHQPASSSSMPHMSATALLQKAAQMGAKISDDVSSSSSQSPATMLRVVLPPGHHHHQQQQQQAHHPPHQYMQSDHHQNLIFSTSAAVASREDELASGCGYGSLSSSFGGNNITTTSNNKADDNNHGVSVTSAGFSASTATSLTIHDMMSYSLSSTNEFDEALNGMLGGGRKMGNGGGGSDGLTRDFLGLKGFPDHRDFINMTGFDQINPSPNPTSSASACGQLQNQNPRSWREG